MSPELNDIIFWGDSRPKGWQSQVCLCYLHIGHQKHKEYASDTNSDVVRDLQAFSYINTKINKTGQGLFLGPVVNWHDTSMAEVSTP